MAEIFISYKSERRKAAAHLAKILERYGYTVWFDYHLVKGEDFADQIDKRIREAKAVIVLWCKLAVPSRWVAREAALARDLNLLIPAKIEPCDLRVDFYGDDYIDLSDWNGAPLDHKLYPLLDGIAHRVARPPQLDFKAMRDFEEDWRRYGALSLEAFALEVQGDQTLHTSAGSSPSVPSPAERDWDCYRIGETEDVAIIKAFIERYGESEPLWDTRARQRLENVEALVAERLKKLVRAWKPPQFKR